MKHDLWKQLGAARCFSLSQRMVGEEGRCADPKMTIIVEKGENEIHFLRWVGLEPNNLFVARGNLCTF
jgi:hypothetical protein